MRTIESVQSTDTPRGGEDTHPAFGVAVLSRRHGSARALFQSDLEHHETISLSIRRASRLRDLNRDWVHPEEELIEVEMSLAQWGALVSSVGAGSGVPLTIRSTESVRHVPELPHQPRLAQNLTEVRESVGKLLADAKRTFAAVTAAFEQKQGIKAVRSALHSHGATLANAESNAAFAVTSVVEAAEVVVSQARADIEAHILQATAATGIQAPIVLAQLDAGQG